MQMQMQMQMQLRASTPAWAAYVPIVTNYCSARDRGDPAGTKRNIDPDRQATIRSV